MKSKRTKKHVIKLDSRELIQMLPIPSSLGSSAASTDSSSNIADEESSVEEEEFKPCPFAEIPYELFIRICEFLSEEEYLTILGVSRYFHRAITEADSIVWRKMCFEKWKCRQGCHNLVLFYEQLERENTREEKWVVALTQRMLLGCLEAVKDSDVAATDGLGSVSLSQSWEPHAVKEIQMPSSSLLLPLNSEGTASGTDFEQFDRNLNEATNTSRCPGESSVNPSYHKGLQDKQKVQGKSWSSPTASAPSATAYHHHRHRRRRHRKPNRRRHQHKHRNRRSNRHENRKRKGYRHHQKSNRKMSKSARRRLRHQRSKRRAQQSPLPLTATYSAIKDSLPTVDPSEVDPDTTMLSLNPRGAGERRRMGERENEDDNGWTLTKDAHDVARVSMRATGAPPSKTFWWNLTPEERLLQLARQQKRCQPQSGEELSSSTNPLEDFYRAWDMLDLPLGNNNETSASSSRSSSADSFSSDISGGESTTSGENQGDLSSQSSHEHFSKLLQRKAVKSHKQLFSINDRNIHMTALEEAILIVRHKCLSLCSLQRRSASVSIVPFTSKHPRLEGSSTTVPATPVFRCTRSQVLGPPIPCPLGAGRFTPLLTATGDGSSVMPVEHETMRTLELSVGKEGSNSHDYSGEWSQCLESELDSAGDDVAYGPISWKFAFYMSRREARRKTLTLHDLVNGIWMVCFRATGKCHPVRFLANSTVMIDPPLSLLERLDQSDTVVESDSASPPLSTSVPPTSTPQQVTLPFHIMQSGARLSFNRQLLTVHHRSSISSGECSPPSANSSSFHVDRGRLNPAVYRSAAQYLVEERFNREPNASIAYLRRVAEDVVLDREAFAFEPMARKSNSKYRSDGPRNLSTAISHMFGWTQGASVCPTFLRTCDISEEARKAVDDDWGWTISNDVLKFFSVELSPPLYIQRLQQISEGKPI